MNEIYYNCDLVTGEAMTTFSGGIFEQLSKYNVRLYTGRLGMDIRKAIAALECTDPYRHYINYKMFPHLQAAHNQAMDYHSMFNYEYFKKFVMGDFPVKHPLDEMLYAHGREFDRKVLKRVNNFIEAERELMYSY